MLTPRTPKAVLTPRTPKGASPNPSRTSTDRPRPVDSAVASDLSYNNGMGLSSCRRVMLSLWGVLCLAAPAAAHPLGNSSITHFSILSVLPDRIEVDFVLDIAETQSVILRREEIDADKDDDDTQAEQNAWLEKNAKVFAEYLRVKVDGRWVPLAVADNPVDPKTGQKRPGQTILKLPGFAGMPNYTLLVPYVGRYPARLEPGEHVLEYTDATYPQHVGLKRIILERISQRFVLDPSVVPDLDNRRLSDALRDAFAEKRHALFSKARVIVDRPGERWRILDAGGNLLVVRADEKLAVHDAPAIEFIPPRPAFWDEGLEPTFYEQYDPANLPDERRATIRFRLTDDTGGIVDRPPPIPEFADAPKRDAPATAPATSTDDTPESGDGESGKPELPPHLASLTDPRNNPSMADTSYRQADRLVALLQGRWGVTMILTVTLLAFTWGAAHALMPGHAKTVVAAYLISQRGTYWHAVLLALIVTVTHTALVVILGLVIWGYQQTHPDLGPSLQLWLGAISGILVAGMGAVLVWRAVTGRIARHHHDHDHPHHDDDRPLWKKLFTHSHPHLPAHAHAHDHHHEHHDHDHAHGHHHEHHHHDHGHTHSHAHDHHHHHDPSHAHHHAHDHEHDHPHPHDHGHPHPHDHDHDHVHEYAPVRHRHADPTDALSFKTLLVLGVTGGIVPCPTATIIMLLGIGAGVVAGALYAIGIFSLGLALTLMTIGFLALSSRRFAARVLSDAQHEGELSGTGRRLLLQAVPALSGTVVVALGLAIAANYLYRMQTGAALFGWLG